MLLLVLTQLLGISYSAHIHHLDTDNKTGGQLWDLIDAEICILLRDRLTLLSCKLGWLGQRIGLGHGQDGE